MEKEFEYKTKGGYEFLGTITNNGKWPGSEEIRWEFDFEDVYDPRGRGILSTLEDLDVVIVNLPQFSEAYDYLTSKEFWDECTTSK